ncbi:MAG: hypothetical protein H6Q70_1099 [Firmicutes bacterium]|nr:hypothetical protein [Bacillota bacterium]
MVFLYKKILVPVAKCQSCWNGSTGSLHGGMRPA